MPREFRLRINGSNRTVSAEPGSPLLYALSNDLQLRGPRFGCGLAQCGSCSVLIDGVEARSCVTPVDSLEGKAVTTLEGIPAWYAGRRGLEAPPALHPVQQALLDEQAPQCGYCYNGIVVKAAELLDADPAPSVERIKRALNGHLCRCGTYPRIVRAVQRAAATMAQESQEPSA